MVRSTIDPPLDVRGKAVTGEGVASVGVDQHGSARGPLTIAAGRRPERVGIRGVEPGRITGLTRGATSATGRRAAFTPRRVAAEQREGHVQGRLGRRPGDPDADRGFDDLRAGGNVGDVESDQRTTPPVVVGGEVDAAGVERRPRPGGEFAVLRLEHRVVTIGHDRDLVGDGRGGGRGDGGEGEGGERGTALHGMSPDIVGGLHRLESGDSIILPVVGISGQHSCPRVTQLLRFPLVLGESKPSTGPEAELQTEIRAVDHAIAVQVLRTISARAPGAEEQTEIGPIDESVVVEITGHRFVAADGDDEGERDVVRRLARNVLVGRLDRDIDLVGSLVGARGVESEPQQSRLARDAGPQSLPDEEAATEPARRVEVERGLHPAPADVVNGNVDEDRARVRG